MKNDKMTNEPMILQTVIDKTPYITLWFELTIAQSRKLDSLGYGPNVFLITISMNEFLKVTKSKKLINDLITMKRETIRIIK